MKRSREGSRFGVCPCCHSSVALCFINSHLDSCLATGANISGPDNIKPDEQEHVQVKDQQMHSRNMTDEPLCQQLHEEAHHIHIPVPVPQRQTSTKKTNEKNVSSMQSSEPIQDQDILCPVLKKSKGESLGPAAGVFPLFRRQKIVHVIRHGHTPLYQLGTATGVQMLDVRLSPLGVQQASGMSHRLSSLNPQVIIVSPLTRALETLKYATVQNSQLGNIPAEVTSLHTEHVSCAGDIGRSPQILAAEFPWLSFESLAQVWWFSPDKAPNDGKFQSRESMENLRRRVAVFHRYLLSRPEQVIAVIGHSTFFKVFTADRIRMQNCEFRKLAL